MSVSIEDAEEVEDIFFDSMFSDLTDACSREFYRLQDHYKFFDIRRLEPSTVAYMNYILKSTGAVIPIDEVVCLDCNRYIWEELCDSYPEEFLVQLHEATILQLFILLPYIIEDAKVKSFDLLNQTEFVEKPGFISVLDDKGAVRSILRDGPLWGDELPSVIVPVSTSDGLVCVAGGEGITGCLASGLSTDDAAFRGCFLWRCCNCW